MSTSRSYESARAFRQALEARLKQLAEAERADIQRLRRQVAFDRLLARLLSDSDPQWALKGGYALELRFSSARATRDVDLTLAHPRTLPLPEFPVDERLLEELRQRATRNLGDFFVFLIGQPTMDIEAAPYGGSRYPVTAQMDGRTFVKFHVDIGIGDPLLEPIEVLTGRDWLGFAGIPAPTFTCISKEQQFAEKLHAYTMPDRPRPNSRVKDLVDMVLMIRRFDLDPDRLADAIDATFNRRESHLLPELLPTPPEDWAEPFVAMAAETGLDITSEEALGEVQRFLSQSGTFKRPGP